MSDDQEMSLAQRCGYNTVYAAAVLGFPRPPKYPPPFIIIQMRRVGSGDNTEWLWVADRKTKELIACLYPPDDPRAQVPRKYLYKQ